MTAPASKNDGMGSLLYPDGTCRFRVWAPFAKSIQLVGDFTDWNENPIELAAEGNTGNWSVEGVPAKPGQLYKYRITNAGGPGNDNSQVWERADARALQVQSSSSTSAGYIVAPFPTKRQAFQTPAFSNFLIYELHVGSFAGRNDGVKVANYTATFLDLIEKLDYIKGLGFTAIGLLPITNGYIGRSGAGEGYGPSDMFAWEEAYASSPENAASELLQLIDAAHLKGLAVIFDVVYNHASTIDNRYWNYDGNSDGGGIYFKDGHQTRFGMGYAMWRREVRDFFLDNARMLLGDYQVDGLRFDAVHFIEADAVESIIGTLRQEFPDKYLIAEYNPSDAEAASPPADPYGTLGFSAIWDLGSPWDTFAALNGNDPLPGLLAHIGDFSDPDASHKIIYLTGSHDEIYGGQNDHGLYFTQRFGGRDNGWARAKARLAYSLNITLPGTPMLFMGTEGHLDGFWDSDVSAGDHRIDWKAMGDPTGSPMQQMVKDANDLRLSHGALRSPSGSLLHRDEANGVLAFKRYDDAGDVILVVVNAGDGEWRQRDYSIGMEGESGVWNEIFSSQAPIYGGINTIGNYGDFLIVADGNLRVNLPSWGVLIFHKRS